MTLYSRLRSFLTALFWRRRFEDELDEELRFHLSAYAEDLMREGIPPAEAARRARAHFGSVERAKDASRLARGLRLADELDRDLRLAARLLVRDRWHALGAASVLALAIGAATAMFTLVNAVLLRGLPVDDERIVFLGARGADGREAGVPLADLEDWDADARTLSEIAAYLPSGMTVGDDVQFPAVVPGTSVSSGLFRLLGARPALGRVFSRAEEQPGAAGTVVLGYALWQDRYGGDPEIVGRRIRVDSRPAVVIGVMPEGFRFPVISDLWLPLGFADGSVSRRDTREHWAVGRLADGVTTDDARAELEAIAARLTLERPETEAGIRPIVQRYSARAVAPQRGLLLILMAAVGLVLLIACANVNGLLLSRPVRRSDEVTLQTALGASRGRILRQLLLESTLLAAVGCLLGAAVAFVAVRFFAAQLEQCELGCMPYWIEWTADGRVLAFMGFTGLATAVLSCVAPALHLWRHDPDDGPAGMGRAEGRTPAARWTNGLLAAEVALTLVLLVAAGLMLRSFAALRDATDIVDGEGLLSFAIGLRESDSTEDRRALLRALEERLAAMPELSASTLLSALPFGGGHRGALQIDGRPPGGPLPEVTHVTVGDEYFEMLGLPLIEGRRFGPGDGEPGREAAIVNRRFVDVFFPDEAPLGRRLRLDDGNAPAGPPPWRIVVGVSPDVPQLSSPHEAEPVVYLPLRGDVIHDVGALVRPRDAGAEVLASIREELSLADENLALYAAQPLEEVMARSRRRQRALMTLLGIFAGLGLALASVGAYSACAYAVVHRRREIGIRMTLGAPPALVVHHFMRQSMAPVVTGLVLGGIGAAAAGRILSGLLVQTGATDRLTFLACAALLVTIAAAACLVSARRATSVDPVSVLRTT